MSVDSQTYDKTVSLKAGEKIEPLDECGHVIIQHERMYRFGGDAVALFKFARKHVRKDSAVFDLCSGCGVIGILLAIECGCRINGAEIDGEMCDMSMRSCVLNGIVGAEFYNADVRDADSVLPAARYDAVVCNPPFYKSDSRASKIAPAANSELTVSLDDVIKASKRLLKAGGALFLVYTSTRMDEVFCACARYGLTPKEITVNPNGKTFLLRAVRGGKQGMTVSVKEY